VVTELRPGEANIRYDDGNTEWHKLPVVPVTESRSGKHQETLPASVSLQDQGKMGFVPPR
jgi:hypothetical protein